MAGQPKTPFYVVLALVVAALVVFAVYRSDILAPRGNANKLGRIDPKQLGQNAGPVKPGPDAAPANLPVKAESPDNAAPPATTVKEYKFKPAERLPDIKGTSAYKPMENNTVRFALNVWAGWGPIILANNGFKPGKVWKTPDGEEFRVELVLIDDPGAMIAAYAAGQVHIGWGTLDMVPLFVDGMVDRTGKPKDSRVMPRIYQQIDWSNGGDGIVVREERQDSCRPARQEAGAGAELAVAVFRPEHAGGRRRAAVGSEHDLHQHGVRGRRRLRRPTRTSPGPSPGRRTSTTWPRPRATACWSTRRRPTS